jgi:XTP/dITP diphosphohydrolase
MNPPFLVVATRNSGKSREFERSLTGLPFSVVGLDRFPPFAAPAETGGTFAANALIKARDAFFRTGHCALADDSGLAVDALGGAPGVFSARYAGPDASDADNVAALLAALRETPDDRRGARFVCVLALVGDGFEETFVGDCAGTIRRTPSGNSGFGYDPVFQPDGRSRTFAEMSAAEKFALSHRGAAVRRLRAFLESRPPHFR